MRLFLVFSALLWAGVCAQASLAAPANKKTSTDSELEKKVGEEELRNRSGPEARGDGSISRNFGDPPNNTRDLEITKVHSKKDIELDSYYTPFGSDSFLYIDEGENYPHANPWVKLYKLMKELFKESDFSILGKPIVQPLIDEKSCLYTIHMGDVPECASVLVGVDGTSVSVEVLDASTHVDTEEVPEAKPQDSPDERSGTAASEVAPPKVDDVEEKENEPKTDNIEQYSTNGNLRGAGMHITRSHSHYFMRFTVDSVCDQNSPETKALRDKDKLLIKMPLKQKKEEEGKIEKEDTEAKDLSPLTEADAVGHTTAGKEQGKCETHKHTIPLVTQEEFEK